MKNQTYTSRRNAYSDASSNWVRNRNTVRHTQKTLGPLMQSVILGALVLIVGLIYVAQGTQATNYDYELSSIEGEIAEMQARKEDLAVEKARLTSIATSSTSEVAMAMVNATAAGYAE